jgi:hypothetical protein
VAKQLDELYSIRRFVDGVLKNTPGVNLMDPPIIYTSRMEENWTRPALLITNPFNVDVPISHQWYKDDRMWVITYFARPTVREDGKYSRDDAANVGENIATKLRSLMNVPLWMFNYIPPTPILREVTGLGSSLTGGVYSVQLLGEDLLGNITKLSANASITITGGSGIDVQCPQHPMGMPIAKKIHVYLSGSLVVPTAGHRVANVAMTNNVDPVFRILADVPSGVTSGSALALAANLPAKSEVRYRQMRVMRPLRSEIVQDIEEDANYNHITRLRTQTPTVLDYDHAQPIAKITETQAVH